MYFLKLSTELNILLVSFSIFISLLFTFMRVTFLIWSYSSPLFYFLLTKNVIKVFFSSVWFYGGFFQEEKWWHGTTETESHAADRGQGGGCVSVCHVINFVGVSTISDDITLKISNPLFTQADFCTVLFISITAKFDGVFHLQAVDQ